MPWLVRGTLERTVEDKRGTVDGALVALGCDSLSLGSGPEAEAAAARAYPVAAAETPLGIGGACAAAEMAEERAARRAEE